MTTNLTIPTTELDRRASALADVQQMHDDLRRALDMIGQLKADNAQKDYRIRYLLDHSEKMRREMHLFRDKCVELATDISNISLLTVRAQNIVMSVRELTEADGKEAINDQPDVD